MFKITLPLMEIELSFCFLCYLSNLDNTFEFLLESLLCSMVIVTFYFFCTFLINTKRQKSLRFSFVHAFQQNASTLRLYALRCMFNMRVLFNVSSLRTNRTQIWCFRMFYSFLGEHLTTEYYFSWSELCLCLCRLLSTGPPHFLP